MRRPHWSPPATWGDLLSEATRPDAAEPVTIHVRAELHARLCAQTPADPATLLVNGADGRSPGIRLAVDDGIPTSPRFEIHRAAPEMRSDTSGNSRLNGDAGRSLSRARAHRRGPGAVNPTPLRVNAASSGWQSVNTAA
jgi:hypothetical protein